MNRFTGNTGGLPLTIDDLEFMLNADREAVLGIVKSILGTVEHAILYGCEITDNEDSYTVAPGYVFFNSEIFYVAGHTLTQASGTYYWTEDVTYDTAGLKVFEDSGEHDTHEVRRAKLAVSETPPSGYMPMADQNVVDVLSSRLGLASWSSAGEIVAINSSDLHLSLDGSISIQSSGGNMLHYKLLGKMIYINIVDLYIYLSGGSAMYLVYIDLPNGISARDLGDGFNIYSFIRCSGFSAGVPPIATASVEPAGSRIILQPTMSNNFAEGFYRFSGQIFFEIA